MKCRKCGVTISDNDQMSWRCMSCGKAFNVNLSKLKKVQIQKDKIENAGKILLKCPSCGSGMDNGDEKIVCKCFTCGNISGGSLEYFLDNGKSSHDSGETRLENRNINLIDCPECGKKISKKASSCPNCGYPIEIQKEISNTKNRKGNISKNRIIIFVVTFCCIITLIVGVFILNNRATGLEAVAKKYVKELENMVGTVDVENVVCFSYTSYGEERISYEYLIIYTQNEKNDFALFLDDEKVGYAGNGYNGGNGNSDAQKTINNINSLSAMKKYLEYLIGEGDEDIITAEDAQNGVEGIIQLDVKKIK